MKIILIALDTLRSDHLGCYGYPQGTSPAIDTLAEEGVVFERHYATDVPTPGSYTAMHTGQRGQRTGIFGFGQTNYEFERSIPSVSTHFANAGYRTCSISNLLYVCPWLARGFHDITPPGLRFQGGTAGEVTAEACRWLDSNHAGDFFLFAHYWDPHENYFKRGPKEYQEQFFKKDYSAITPDDRFFSDYPMVKGALEQYAAHSFQGETDFAKIIPAYDACIRYADDGVRDLVAHLKKLGIDDETLLIITSDHGEAFGERGAFDHITCYENISHVPLIVRFPSKIKAGQRVSGYTSGTDLVPTMLDLAGLEIDDGLSGTTLVPSLTIAAPAPREEVVTNCASIPIQRMHVRDGWGLVHTVDNPIYQFIKPYELFNIDEDPAQENDLSAAEPVRLAEMKAHYERWCVEEMQGKPDKLLGIPFRGGGWSLKLLYSGFYENPELYYQSKRHRELIDGALGSAAKRYYKQVTGNDPAPL